MERFSSYNAAAAEFWNFQGKSSILSGSALAFWTATDILQQFCNVVSKGPHPISPESVFLGSSSFVSRGYCSPGV
jgi:hypothetical protein